VSPKAKKELNGTSRKNVEELNHANIFMFKGSSYTSKLVISI
jgi:branched-subunit amino acid aminotransferase/4-amino-4-deoxychorismate lyase